MANHGKGIFRGSLNANRDLQISQSSVIEMKDGKPVMDENGDPLPRSIGMVDVSGERGGGQIFIRAGHFVLDRALIYADNYGDGQGFSIDIGIDGEMFLKNAAKITTDNYANGYGGNLTITARTLLQLSGQNGEWKLKREPERECQDCFSTIAANNSGPGDKTKPFQSGGNIQINTSTLEITPGLIQTATQTDGRAGNTTIVADKVILKGQKYEAPDKYEKQGYIAANTQGKGQGGTINITAKDMISLEDSNITAQTDGIGKAGDISIKTEKLNLANKGIISSLSNLEESNAGNAGSIDIEAGIVNISTDRNVPISKDTLDNVSGIAVLAQEARGGNIDMKVRDSLSLVHSKITAKSTGPSSSDNGGNIWINRPPFSKLKGFTLDEGYLLANANAGNGGVIDIQVETGGFKGHDSKINVSSRLGLNGNFYFNSVGLKEVVIPPHEPLNKGNLLPLNRCSFSKENQSRFIITARDILPRCPEDLRTHTIRLWSPK